MNYGKIIIGPTGNETVKWLIFARYIILKPKKNDDKMSNPKTTKKIADRRQLINKHLGVWGGLYQSSIEEFAKSRKIRGKLLIAIEELMQEHTAQTLDRLKEKIKQVEKNLEAKISKLNLSGNPDDWILASDIENVIMGVHSIFHLIEEIGDDYE